MPISSFKDLIVWQKSMALITEIYAVTAKLPPKEAYGLTSQLQRASVSIPSNIAEGSKRSSRADFRQYCIVALGSAAEVETQLLIIQQIYPVSTVDKALGQITEIQKMLSKLVNRLRNP